MEPVDEKMAKDLKGKSRDAFDAQAATYDADMYGSHARSLYPHVIDEVKRAVEGIDSPRLLDLGCGTGALAEALLEEIANACLACVDLSPKMLELAKERLAGRADVSFVDVEGLPFSDSSFDAAWCNDSFHHYPDPKKAAFQMWRVLKPGGTLVVGDVWQPAPARAIMNAWMPYSNEGDVRIYSESEMCAILGTWFNDVQWRRIGTTACLAVARKIKP